MVPEDLEGGQVPSCAAAALPYFSIMTYDDGHYPHSLFSPTSSPPSRPVCHTTRVHSVAFPNFIIPADCARVAKTPTRRDRPLETPHYSGFPVVGYEAIVA